MNPTDGYSVHELNDLKPETHLGYNAGGNLIIIRRYTATGKKFERSLIKDDETDFTVDYWDKITSWQQVI